jgi:lipopolysaccharide export system protein LptA
MICPVLLAALVAAGPVNEPKSAPRAAVEAPAAAAPKPAPPAPKPAAPVPAHRPEAMGGQGPLDFRCDKMQVLTKPNRTLCEGNVVFRRGTAFVCCKHFEGFANDKWDLERGVCTDDVRAQRGEELMWSEKADYTAQSGELVLTGRPVLRRGLNIIEGERVVALVNEDQARVDKPKGHLVPEEQAPATGAKPAEAPSAKPADGPKPPAPKLPPPPPPYMSGPLPATCPLPVAPRR